MCVVALGVSAVSGASAQAVAPSLKTPAQIQFTYDNPAIDPARYSIVVDETGRGKYHSEPGPRSAYLGEAEMPSQPQDTALTLSTAIRDYLFATARSRKLFAIQCEDGKGKMALQGKKVLSYQGSDGTGACTYNWSKDERIERLTRIFEGVSATLEAGARLAREHRHDPLALDQELAALASDLKDGRAAEIGNIATELQSIAQDETVMQRARSRAATLLSGSAPRLP